MRLCENVFVCVREYANVCACVSMLTSGEDKLPVPGTFLQGVEFRLSASCFGACVLQDRRGESTIPKPC